jgi:hypothetical protein
LQFAHRGAQAEKIKYIILYKKLYFTYAVILLSDIGIVSDWAIAVGQKTRIVLIQIANASLARCVVCTGQTLIKRTWLTILLCR